MQAFNGVFDGNWVDIFTLLTAIVYALWQHHKVGRPVGRRFVCRETGASVLHGVALFPLFLLTVASISSMALDALIHSHKIILFGAGAMALFAILEEDPTDEI